jgi:hypothetical protein
MIPFKQVFRKINIGENNMRPIQGPLRQTIGIPANDGSNKDVSYVQTPPQLEEPARSQASKDQSVAEAKLQGNLRAAELNAAYQHNQTDLEFLRSNKSSIDANFKGEITGIEPAVQNRNSNSFLPEVNDEVLIKKKRIED